MATTEATLEALAGEASVVLEAVKDLSLRVIDALSTLRDDHQAPDWSEAGVLMARLAFIGQVADAPAREFPPAARTRALRVVR